MASSYPGALDTLSNMSTSLAGPPTHSSIHTAANDAIEAVQAELGTDPAGAFATVKLRHEATESRLLALDGGSTTRRWVHLGRSGSLAISAGSNNIAWNAETDDPMNGITVPVTAVPLGATLGACMVMILVRLSGGAITGDVVRAVFSTAGSFAIAGNSNTDTFCFGPIPLGAAETVTININSAGGSTLNASGTTFYAYRLGA